MPFHRPPRRSPARPSVLTPIASALFWLCSGSLGWMPGAAVAQEQPGATAPRAFDIPAGPLDQALSRFGRQSGVQIVVDGRLTAGLHSPGLSGSHAVPQGLGRLLAGTGLQAVRGSGGEYTLRRLPPVGFPAEAALAPVTVVAGNDLSLAEQAATNYTVSRSSGATKLDLSIKETPQSLSIITEKQIEEQNLTQITDVLDATPGVTVQNYGVPGAGRASFYSRGYEVSNLMVDGMPTGSGAFGGMDLLAGFDTAIYERVEIVRGSTGLSSGIGDPSASINFVRKRPALDAQRSVKLSYGRWDKARVEADLSQPFNESGSLRGRLVAAYGQGSHWVDRVEDESKLIYGVFEADLGGRDTLTIGGTWFDKYIDDATPHGARLASGTSLSNGVFDNGRDFNAATRWSYAHIRNRNAFAGWEHRFNDDWKLNLNYQYTRSTPDRLYGVFGLDFYNAQTNIGSYSVGRLRPEDEMKNLDVALLGKFAFFGRESQVAVGYSGYRGETHTELYTGRFPLGNPDRINFATWNDGNMPFPGNYIMAFPPVFPRDFLRTPVGFTNVSEKQHGFFLSTKTELVDKLKIILGARYNRYQIESGTFNYATGLRTNGYEYKPENKVVPYVGVVYDVTPSTSVYASYTGIYKPQLVKDINDDFLDPEEGNSIELGIKSTFYDERLNLHAAVFKMEQENLAFDYGVAPRDANGNMIFCTAIDGQQCIPQYGADGPSVSGIELSAAGQITPRWLVNAGYTFLRLGAVDGYQRMQTVGMTNGDYSFERPKHQFNLATSYRFNDRLTVGGSVRWKSKTTQGRPALVGNNGYVIDEKGAFANRANSQGSYAVVDAMARFRINKKMVFGLNVQNIFDEVYKVNDRGSYYGSPRSLTASLSIVF